MTQLMHFDKARQHLEQARNVDEVKQIRDQAEALRTYLKQQSESLTMQNQAAEIKLRAERQAGKLLNDIPREQGKRTDTTSFHHGTKLGKLSEEKKPYEQVLKENDIAKVTAHRWQLAATELTDEDFDTYIEQTKANKKELTSTAIQKEAQRKRQEHFRQTIQEQKEHPYPSQSIDIYTTNQVYRVLYADPPWFYGNEYTQAMPGSTRPEDHYLAMKTPDICQLPIRHLVCSNAVLFLWSTSTHLPDALQVCQSWGFTYKTSLVWDKIKHNWGPYISVRHELLLLCTRGSCTPDVTTLYDSVQSLERTVHSAKPERFREIIDTLYPNGNRLELFARQPVLNWDVWGNEV
jgi:N6-adenosine-specific RNA methylase IME4